LVAEQEEKTSNIVIMIFKRVLFMIFLIQKKENYGSRCRFLNIKSKEKLPSSIFQDFKFIEFNVLVKRSLRSKFPPSTICKSFL